MKFLLFSKRFEHLSLEELAATVAGLGLDGVDLTVRSTGHNLPEAAAGTAGHVAPDRVHTDLPHAVDVCRAHGLDIGWITTDITSAESPARARSSQPRAHAAYASSNSATITTGASAICGSNSMRCDAT